MFATVSKWGNSGGIRIPKAILESLHIEIGDKIRIFLDGDRAVIEPVKKVSLKELVSKIPENYRVEEEIKSTIGLEKW
jgi:antitoxin MazE